MTAVFYIWAYGSFIEIQSNLRRKKLHRTDYSSNFLGSSFSNRDNVRIPIQFRREVQPQHFKRCFFLKNRPIHFHIFWVKSDMTAILKWGENTISRPNSYLKNLLFLKNVYVTKGKHCQLGMFLSCHVIILCS